MDTRELGMKLIDGAHDPDLTMALGRWASSQEVGTHKLAISLLRLASLCIGKTLQHKPAEDECAVIRAYADYFHFYVHAAVEILEEDKKSN